MILKQLKNYLNIRDKSMEQLLKVLDILKKYPCAEDFLFAEHNVIGFNVDFEQISNIDIKKLNNLGVFFDYAYYTLVMYV